LSGKIELLEKKFLGGRWDRKLSEIKIEKGRFTVFDTHIHFYTTELVYKWFTKYNFPKAEVETFVTHLYGSPKELVGNLDLAGVDMALIFQLALPEKFEAHDIIADIIKRYPDRFIGEAWLDPLDGEQALRELERCLSVLGFKALKILPPFGFRPDDKRGFPMYEKCIEHGVPVTIHTYEGSPFTSTRTMGWDEYARPKYVEAVAKSFPDLNIICAHMGSPYFDEMIRVAQRCPNVYLEPSGRSVWTKPNAIEIVRKAIKTLGPDRVVFGSDDGGDSPGQEHWTLRTRKAMEIVVGPLPEEDKRKILGENALRLLGLNIN